MVEGTHHWRSGDVSGAPVMSRLFNISRGGSVHLDVPKGFEFPVGIRTLLNMSRYVTWGNGRPEALYCLGSASGTS